MNEEIRQMYDKTIMDFSVEQEFFPDWECPENWVKIFYKTYPRLPKTTLEMQQESGELIDVLEERSSRRDFIDEPVERSKLDSLVYYSMGIKNLDEERTADTRRFYPSGGARYPIEGYLISNNVGDLTNGVYHYDVKHNCWENLLERDLREESQGLFGPEISQNFPNFLVLSGVISRSEVKYDIHAYRFSLLEAGHVAQNIALMSTKIGIGTCPIGGFDNNIITTLLDLPDDEIPLYAIAVGNVGSEKD